MTRSIAVVASTVFVVLFSAGCASVPEAYYPQNTGPSVPAMARSGVQVHISADSETAVKGDPIRFAVEIENVSGEELLIPRRPHILFAWTYANGVRDNFISEVPSEWFYAAGDVVALEPGARLRLTVPVKTYYFDRLGITEFLAIVKSPRNTNPELKQVWQGYATSNRYGIRVTGSRDYAWLQ